MNGQMAMKMSDSPVVERIRRAKEIYREHGAALLEAPSIAPVLDRYRDLVGQTQSAMHRFGVVSGCTRCAQEDHGSCCFEGIEDGYGISLLLVNLLMGCDIPEEKEIPGSCLFVGGEGCKLKARFYFCLHYLCPRLREALGGDGSKKLLQILGKELQGGWEIEMEVLRWLRTQEVSVHVQPS